MAVRRSQPELAGFEAPRPREFVAFRQTDYDVPFWARNNTYPGRWNRPGDEATQYWSLDPDGAWAEFVRQEELGSNDLPLIRRPMWICRISIGSLIDLRERHVREQHSTDLGTLLGADWEPCQLLAAKLRAAGAGGLLTPSAALDGCSNLTIFGPRRAIDWTRRPALHSTVPAAITAVGGPTADIVERVGGRPGSPPDRLF